MIAGFYTYIHTRADDGKVFYVGKGKGARATCGKNRNQHWRNTAAKHGMRADIAAHWPTEAEAFDHEKFLIACFRDMGHPLCNLTNGGDGPSGLKHSAETRAKISRIQIGKKLTPEHKAKLGAASLGHTLSAESRKKISEKNTGKKRTEEQRRVNSEARKGKRLSPEHAKKIAAAHTGQKRSEETRARIAAAHKGRSIPPETRARIAATLTGRKPSEATRAKLIAIANSPERRAQHSAAMKGRPWSEARRAAQQKEGA